MTLGQYLKIIDIESPIEQLEILGLPKDITVKKANSILKDKFNMDYDEKPVNSFKVGGRKFKLHTDIEDMVASDYAYFKQIIGDVYANEVDSEDKVIEIGDEQKQKKLMLQAHKIISIFSKEVGFLKWFKKRLSFEDQCELMKKLEISKVISIVFFYVGVIANLVRNGQIYYLELMKESQTIE